MTARDTGTADQLADESAISAIYNSVLGVEKASAWRDRLAADRIDDRQCDIAARHLPQLPGMNDAAKVAADVGQANLWSGGPPQTLWARRDRLQRHFERALYLRAKLCHDDQSGVAADFIEVLPGGGGKWLMIAGDNSICGASAGWPTTGRATDDWVERKIGIFGSYRAEWQGFFSVQSQPQDGWPGAPGWPSLAILRKPRSGLLLCQALARPSGAADGAVMLVEELPIGVCDICVDQLTEYFGFDTAEKLTLRQIFYGEGWLVLHTATGGRRAPELPILGSMLSKTGAPNYGEMLRLLTNLLAQSTQDQAIATGQTRPEERILTTDVGLVQYLRFGADNGHPVIFTHGIFDGIAPLQRLQDSLRRRGLRVLAPWRNGYGGSGPIEPKADPVDTYLAQVEALIDEEGLEAPIILGHRSGCLFAAEAARRLRDRIAGVVCVGATLPLQSVGETGALRGHQRAMALSAVRAKAMLPLIVRSWRRNVRRKGPAVLVSQQMAAGEDERKLLSDPSLAALLDQSHRSMMDQGGGGYESDLKLAVRQRDMRHSPKAAPAIYLHGGQDQVTPVEKLQAALGGADNLQLRVCRRAGSMLFYSQPDWVLSALEEMRST